MPKRVAGEGFENRLAALLARDLGLRVAYHWWPQRRGFVRNTLKLGDCDVVMGISAESELVLTTQPYYRSTYVFLGRLDHRQVRSLDDTVLRHMSASSSEMGAEAKHKLAIIVARRAAR